MLPVGFLKSGVDWAISFTIENVSNLDTSAVFYIYGWKKEMEKRIVF